MASLRTRPGREGAKEGCEGRSLLTLTLTLRHLPLRPLAYRNHRSAWSRACLNDPTPPLGYCTTAETIVAAPMTTAGGNVAWLRSLLYPHLSSADAHAEIDAQAPKHTHYVSL